MTTIGFEPLGGVEGRQQSGFSEYAILRAKKYRGGCLKKNECECVYVCVCAREIEG